VANERAAARIAVAMLWAVSLVGCALPTSLGQLSAETDGATGSSSSSSSGEESSSSATGSSSSGLGPTTSNDTDMIGPLEMQSWVMRYDDYIAMQPDGPGTDSGGDSAGTGSEIPPDTLVVNITTGPNRCDDPWAGLECGEQWSISMRIPPELQAPGEYMIFEQLDGFYMMTGPFEGGDQCSGGGGSLEGVATLAVVGEQEVSGQLSMTFAVDFDADIAFTASACG